MWLVNLAVSFPSTCIVCTPPSLPHLLPLGLVCTLTCERHALGHQHPQQDILQHSHPRGRCPFWILLFKSFAHTNRAVCCVFEYAHSKNYVDCDLVLLFFSRFPKAEKLLSSWGGHITMESCSGYSSCSLCPVGSLVSFCQACYTFPFSMLRGDREAAAVVFTRQQGFISARSFAERWMPSVDPRMSHLSVLVNFQRRSW